MTTYNHTPIPSSPPQAANAATINAPLGQLDAVIDANATAIDVNATAIGTLALLTSPTKTNVVTAINEHAARGQNLHFFSLGVVTWNPTTKILAFAGSLIIDHGVAGGGRTTITGPLSLDFSGITNAGFALLPGIVWGSNQTFAATDILVREYNAYNYDLRLAGTITLASYYGGRVSTPFSADRYWSERAHMANRQFFSIGTIVWNPATKVLAFGGQAFIDHGLLNPGGRTVIGAAAFNIDFSALGTSSGFAYISGVTWGTTQTITAITVAAYNALTVDLRRDDVVVIASYYNGSVQSPFLANRAFSEGGGGRNYQIKSTNKVTWNPTTKGLTIDGTIWVYWLTITTSAQLGLSAPGTISFAGMTRGVAYITGATPGVSQYAYTAADIHVEEVAALTHNLRSVDTIVLAYYDAATNRVQSPLLSEAVQSAVASREAIGGAPWHNLYPGIHKLLPTVTQKLLLGAEDVRVLLWGDSIFEGKNYTSAVADPTATPPMCAVKGIAWQIWRNLPGNKAAYKRYDAVGYFTFTGTWAATDTDATWDDSMDRVALTDVSVSTNASIAWTLGTSDDESGCNLIYRTDTAGDAAATITAAAGNGYLEYWTGAAWAEANGATFSMQEVDEGARRGNTIYQKRLRLRKAVAHANASVTITIGKASADADRLLFWGVELYDAKNSKPFCQVIDSARGSHSLAQLYEIMDDDVIDWAPDLIVLEVPMMNMASAGKASCVNWVQDIVWGDRAGAANAWALKKQLPSADILLVMPHYARQYFDTANQWVELAANLTARDVYNAVRALIHAKGDVALIDVGAAYQREIDATWGEGNYYAALTGSNAYGLTLTTDNTHPNDRGALVYARHICPVFDCGSVVG